MTSTLEGSKRESEGETKMNRPSWMQGSTPLIRSRHLLLLVVPILLVVALPFHAMAQADTFDSAGLPIYYLDMGGDGEPVILVHSMSSSSAMWINAGFEPSDDFRFIALDVRGHGRSGKPEEPEAYGLDMVEDIARLMDHLGIEAAHIVGYSMGAEIALKFTSEHPARVRSLVVGGSGWSEERKAAELYEATAMGLAGSTTFAAAVRSMLPPEVTDEQFAGMIGVFERHGVDTANPDTTGLALAARSMNEIVDLSEEDVTAISVPVLGIVNEADYERPGVERLEGVVSDFELVLLPAVTGDGNLDHLGATLDPLFRASILEFLHGQDQRGSN